MINSGNVLGFLVLVLISRTDIVCAARLRTGYFGGVRQHLSECCRGGNASGILNLCRYAAFAVEGKVLTHLPEKWRDFIRFALDIESCIGDIAWNFDGCETFR